MYVRLPSSLGVVLGFVKEVVRGYPEIPWLLPQAREGLMAGRVVHLLGKHTQLSNSNSRGDNSNFTLPLAHCHSLV